MTERMTTTESSTALHADGLERRLHEQLARSEAHLTELESILADMLRGHDTLQEDQDSTRRLVDAVREDVRRTREALGRLGDGTYGSCVGCGQPIPLERLDAIPTATHCARCA